MLAITNASCLPWECLFSVTFSVSSHCLIHHDLDTKMSISAYRYLYPICSFFLFELMPRVLPSHVGLHGLLLYETKVFPQSPDSAIGCIAKNFHQNKSTNPISNIFLKLCHHKGNSESIVKCCSIYWNSHEMAEEQAVQSHTTMQFCKNTVIVFFLPPYLSYSSFSTSSTTNLPHAVSLYCVKQCNSSPQQEYFTQQSKNQQHRTFLACYLGALVCPSLKKSPNKTAGCIWSRGRCLLQKMYIIQSLGAYVCVLR